MVQLNNGYLIITQGFYLLLPVCCQLFFIKWFLVTREPRNISTYKWRFWRRWWVSWCSTCENTSEFLQSHIKCSFSILQVKLSMVFQELVSLFIIRDIHVTHYTHIYHLFIIFLLKNMILHTFWYSSMHLIFLHILYVSKI